MISKIFSAEGALGKVIKGFQPRKAQLQMAEAVSTAIQSSQQVVIEAAQERERLLLTLFQRCKVEKRPSSVQGQKTSKSNCFTVIYP